MIRLDIVDHIPFGTAAPAWLTAPLAAVEVADDVDEDTDADADANCDNDAGGPVQTALVDAFGDAMFAGLLGHVEQYACICVLTVSTG